MVVFPIFIVLGHVGRSPRLDTVIRAVFVALLAVMAVLFAISYTAAGV
jgi:hypothetical protein